MDLYVLFIIGGLITFVMAFVSLIRPTWGMPNRLKPTRLKGFFLHLVLSFVLMAAGGGTIPPEVREQQKHDREVREKQREADAAAQAAQKAESDRLSAERKAESDRQKAEQKAEADRAKAEEKIQDDYKDIVKSVLGVTKINGHVTVKMKLAGFSAENDFTALTFDMKKVAQWQAEQKEEIAYLHILVMGGVKDKYGNVTDEALARLSLPSEDLHRINWANFNSWNLVNLMQVTSISMVGKQVIAAYCVDGDNMKYARKFCLSAVP